jgi:hypothetical protein
LRHPYNGIRRVKRAFNAKSTIMWFNKNKINRLSIESDELPNENIIYDPVEVEKKNLELLTSLNNFYERLLFLSRLFNFFGFQSLALGLLSAYVWWPITSLFIAIAICCFWYARYKKLLSDCAPSFIRFIMYWDEEIRKANASAGYEISPPKPEDFI